jgi:hypothetical protein
MLQGVLIDEAIEVLFQLAGEVRRASRARAIDSSLRALAGKAIDPLAPGGRRPLEGVRDGLPTRPLHDMAHDVAHGGRRGLLGSAFRRSLR